MKKPTENMMSQTVIQSDDPQGPAADALIPQDNSGVIANTAQELSGGAALAEERSTPAVFQNDSEPHGMFWAQRGNTLVLIPHNWFVEHIAVEADKVFMQMHSELSLDTEAQELSREMAAGLRQYLEARRAANDMAYNRKLQQEINDGCYQFCQAAKYFLDAGERIKFASARGLRIDDDQTVPRLRELSQMAAREGWMILTAAISIADSVPRLDFHSSARRVADYSARKLTEWYATKRLNEQRAKTTSNNAALMDLVNFFKK